MRVLVTGGSGVVGDAAVRALVRRGHTVRLLARHADDAIERWPHDVEAHAGDVTDPASLAGAADGCDAVLHLVAIVDESSPELTFERVNVDGTRHVVAEAARAGVTHLVYVSSLGAERGASDYHRSKLAGEREASALGGGCVIVRLGNVYGPGDEVVSLILKMVRALPAVPVIGGGDQPFQPIWADDAGEALAAAIERADLAGRTLDVTGPERTSMNDLLDRFAQLTDRRPARVPLPGAIAGLGVRIASALGVDLPVNEGQLTMLAEGSVIDAPATNALDTVLGVTPTPLDDGLRRLLDTLPEQLPDDGVGRLHRKRFWADISGATMTPEELFARFCHRFQELSPDLMDLEAEPSTRSAVLDRGQTVTMALPMRGNVQVRVAELAPRCLTLQTVEGHPLAGAVRFTLDDVPDALRFQIELVDRAATVVDWVAMAALGERLQSATWHETIENVVSESGGSAPHGVQTETARLTADEATAAEEWLASLAAARVRESNDATS